MKKIIIASIATALMATTALAEGVTEADLANDTATTTSILTNGMGRHLQRHSPLEMLNKSNVKNLLPAWAFSLGGEKQRGQETQPLIHDGLMFFVNNGIGNAIDAKTGERVKQLRLQPAPNADDSGGARQRRRGRSLDYSSPVIAGDNVYYVKRNGEMYVLSADKELKQIAVNRVTKDSEEFSATPAISNGQIFVRSNKRLYCIEDSSE